MTNSKCFLLMTLVSALGGLAYVGCGSDDAATPTPSPTAEAGTPVSPAPTTPPAVDGGPRTCGTKTLCSDNCVDTQLDRENCGACGKACGPSEVC